MDQMIAKGTLEQKIQEPQRKKAELADAVLAGGAAQDLALAQADLQAILAPWDRTAQGATPRRGSGDQMTGLGVLDDTPRSSAAATPAP